MLSGWEVLVMSRLDRRAVAIATAGMHVRVGEVQEAERRYYKIADEQRQAECGQKVSERR